MATKVVNLPKLPEGKEYEEFLAAYLQCAGLYVERSVIDRQDEEVLELDIITTSYGPDSLPESRLIEVKSGGWGFPDIFKIRGWMHYTGMDNGCLMVRQGKDSQDFVSEIASNIGIDVIHVPDHEFAPVALSHITNGSQPESLYVSMWRFSYWIERKILKSLTTKKKSQKDRVAYPVLDRYYNEIHNQVFFTENIVDRLDKLYNTYKEHPNLSARLGQELAGNSFHDDHDTIPKSLFSETYYSANNTDLVMSTFIEHRSRLAILKAAIDYKITKEINGDPSRKIKIDLGDYAAEYSYFDTLPETFRNGLDAISKHKYCYRYPVFWQWFLWFMGGFILNDHKDAEYAFLSKVSGIPVDHIPKALGVYDLLFPQSGGWFAEQKHSSMTILKLMPLPFIGLGAQVRKRLYTTSNDIGDIKVSGRYTVDDLIKYNDSVVEFLA